MVICLDSFCVVHPISLSLYVMVQNSQNNKCFQKLRMVQEERSDSVLFCSSGTRHIFSQNTIFYFPCIFFCVGVNDNNNSSFIESGFKNEKSSSKRCWGFPEHEQRQKHLNYHVKQKSYVELLEISHSSVKSTIVIVSTSANGTSSICSRS